MLTQAERINRRIGRLEALVADLTQLPPNYKFTQMEAQRAFELQTALSQVFSPPPETPEEAKPEAKPGKAGKK
jgi:hypothetical protein